MKKFFLELSKIENGEYKYKEQIISTGMGSRSPYDVHILKINYKDQQIIIKNEIGTANIGSVLCELPISIKQTEFSIRTRSHFFKLFSKDENAFIIKCLNDNLKNYFHTNLNALEKYTLETQFELSINGALNNSRFEIITEYNLIFENREKVLIALIQLYKDLINNLY